MLTPIKSPLMMKSDADGSVLLPNYHAMSFDILSDFVDVSVISSYTRQKLEVARSYQYAVVLPVDEPRPTMGQSYILSYGVGNYANTQRVFVQQVYSIAEDYQQAVVHVRMVGFSNLIEGAHLPKLFKYRFDLGDGTFAALILTEQEIKAFDKEQHIDRYYRKGI